MTITDKLYLLLQRCIPQHFLSGCMFTLMHSDLKSLKNFLINQFIKRFDVDMSSAIKQTADEFIHFNDFFVRELKPDARPIAAGENAIACPVDGCVSQAGELNDEMILQAKGHHYYLSGLLAGDMTLSQQFKNGVFATLYLSPRDYHRIHMPLDGTLKKQIYVPGDLFAVNPTTVNNINGVFARNERTILHFETAEGPMIVILVGAIFVGSMETVWQRTLLSPPYGNAVESQEFDIEGESAVHLKKGQELGRFNMGSTVILLFPESHVDWAENLVEGQTVRMGEEIGSLR